MVDQASRIVPDADRSTGRFKRPISASRHPTLTVVWERSMQYDDRLTPELISRCLRDRRALGLLWGPSRRSHAAVRAIMVTYTPARLFGIRQRNTSARRARRGGWQRGVSISTVRAATRRAGRGIRSPEQRGDQHDRDDHIKEIQHHQHRTEPVRSGRKQPREYGQCSQRREHNQRHHHDANDKPRVPAWHARKVPLSRTPVVPPVARALCDEPLVRRPRALSNRTGSPVPTRRRRCSARKAGLRLIRDR